jgi:hypothetical protein
VRCVKKCMGVCEGTDIRVGDCSMIQNRNEGQIGKSPLVREQPEARKGAQSCIKVRSVHPLLFNALKTEINVNYNFRLGPYRAVNTLRLSYKNQLVNAA